MTRGEVSLRQWLDLCVVVERVFGLCGQDTILSCVGSILS